jgi:hypothetical protein
MKSFGLILVFIFWSIMTLVFLISIIGWFIVLPRINESPYVKSPEDQRSAWMWMGLDIKNKMLESLS